MATTLEETGTTQLPQIPGKLPESEQVDGAEYWSRTSADDLNRMLHEAQYPDEVRVNFLDWYRATICPLLGHKRKSDSRKCGVGWDGNPLEYSFEMNESTAKPKVRFVVDLTQLRPLNEKSPLGIENAQRVIDLLSKCTDRFDDTWFRALKKYMMYDHLPTHEQQALVDHAGQQTQLVLGFDISRQLPKAGGIPVMGKVYFPPCFASQARGLTRWEASYQAIQQLPGIEQYSNITKAASLISEYLADKPREWQMGVRWLATDLVEPAKARFKVYLRCFDTEFEGMWDYYTLGGRITHLDDDKAKFSSLLDSLGQSSYAKARNDQMMDLGRFQSVTKKLTAVYFSISPESPLPTPKLCIYPSNFASNDETIAKGLDGWLQEHGWQDGEENVETRIKKIFTHRTLDTSTGIFTFIGVGRKEGSAKKGLSMQVYVTPELYKYPRL